VATVRGASAARESTGSLAARAMGRGEDTAIRVRPAADDRNSGTIVR
jgi:hypothetical protein